MASNSKISAHSLRQRAKVEKLFSAANSALADARVAFVSLFLLSLLLASVASTTTHLDLLVGSKISLPTQSVEVSRQAMLLIGSLILAGIHFQALRSHLLAAEQLSGLSRISPNPRLLGLELRANMITDAFFTSVGNAFSRTLSNILLCAVLLVIPLLTLFFVQLVTLPAHSNLLTGIIRLILVIDTITTVAAIVLFFKYLKFSINDSKVRSASFLTASACVITFLPALAGMIIAMFPGEYYERLVVKAVENVFPPLVASSDLKDGEKISSLGISCLVKNSYRSSEIQQKHLDRPAINSDSPGVFRAVPIVPGFEIIPTCRYYGPALTSTITVMTWLELATGFNISRNLHLQGQTISGQNIPANERSLLSEHSEAVPLHPEFKNTLSKVIRVDLTSKDLRYANFDNAFMPRVQLNGEMIYGATFRNSNLQGAEIVDYESAHGNIKPGHRLTSPFDSADISAASFVRPRFLAEVVENLKAISTKFDNCRFAGVEIRAGLWQGSTFSNCTFQDYEISKKSRLATRVLSANMSGSNFLETDFHRVYFGSGQDWTSNSAKLDSSNWARSRISDGSTFSGLTLRGADFSEAEIGRVRINKSDLSFASFKSIADPELSVDSILTPMFVIGTTYKNILHKNQKVFLLSDEKQGSMMCMGSDSGTPHCKAIDERDTVWKNIAIELRLQSCELATQSEGFNPDLSIQIIKIFRFGGVQVRNFLDAAAIPPTARGKQESCGVNLNGKKTVITMVDKNEI